MDGLWFDSPLLHSYIWYFCFSYPPSLPQCVLACCCVFLCMPAHYFSLQLLLLALPRLLHTLGRPSLGSVQVIVISKNLSPVPLNKGWQVTTLQQLLPLKLRISVAGVQTRVNTNINSGSIPLSVSRQCPGGSMLNTSTLELAHPLNS